MEMKASLRPCVTDPVGPPPHWKNWPKIRPRWEKYPKISSPLENYTELSSPLGRTPKFWKSPLDFCAVNNRIQNSHSLKARDFPSPLTFGAFILSPLAKKFSPGHWDRGVWLEARYFSTLVVKFFGTIWHRDHLFFGCFSDWFYEKQLNNHYFWDTFFT